MTWHELLVIAALSAPAGTPEPWPAGEDARVMAAAVKGAADSLGLYYSGLEGPLPENWQRTVDGLRRQRRELRDAPPVTDALRLPDYECCYGRWHHCLLCSQDADERHETCLFCHPIESRPLLDSYLLLAARSGFWWDMATAANPDAHPYHRRLALKRIRAAAGPADYFHGDWPPWYLE